MFLHPCVQCSFCEIRYPAVDERAERELAGLRMKKLGEDKP
jgi:hypothetical protein